MQTLAAAVAAHISTRNTTLGARVPGPLEEKDQSQSFSLKV